jgi:zinc protease
MLACRAADDRQDGSPVTDARRSDAPEIHRAEIDGVPVFWTPVDGPRLATLMFRVGRADEPANMGGISHLVEHLALAPLSQQDYGHNGFVAPLRTVFHATGTDAQLVDYVGTVCGNLGQLPLERILMERRILSQEAASRSAGSSGMQRWFRYGFQGHGLVGAQELGLGWLGPDPIAAWSREWFTRQNAALWWSGEPPADLRLELPDGERKLVPHAVPLPTIRFPARNDLGGDGVSFGFVGARTAATRIVQDVLVRRLRQDLRFERGLIYDVGSDYDPIGPGEALASIGMDCTRVDATEVAATILRTLDDIGSSGATADEIAREAAAFEEGSGQPGGRLGFLDSTTQDALLGRSREAPADIVAEYRAVTPEATRAVAGTASQSLLLFAPPGAYDEAAVSLYPGWSAFPVPGRSIRPSGWLVGPKARKDRLIVGPDGVSWVAPDGRSNTVRYADCVAIRHWEGPIRELWGADGFRVVVDAAEWRGGPDVVAALDAALPASLIACDEHGIGALENPKPAQAEGAAS